MASSKGTKEPKFTGIGTRAGILGPKTKIQNTAIKTNVANQRGKAKGGAIMANAAGPGKNVKRFGQGKATDNRSARKGQ